MLPLSIDGYMVFHPDHDDIVNAEAVAPAGFVLSNRPGHQVSSYRELLIKIAKLAYHNSRFRLDFRGQSKDYSLNHRGEPISTSSLYPSILRQTGTENRNGSLRQRFDKLSKAEELLNELPISMGELHQNQLIRWALLQHYEVTSTPLLDVTLSLQHALSFALKNGQEEGHLYAFALPHPHGPLSVSLEIIILARWYAELSPETKNPGAAQLVVHGVARVLLVRRMLLSSAPLPFPMIAAAAFAHLHVSLWREAATLQMETFRIPSYLALT